MKAVEYRRHMTCPRCLTWGPAEPPREGQLPGGKPALFSTQAHCGCTVEVTK